MLVNPPPSVAVSAGTFNCGGHSVNRMETSSLDYNDDGLTDIVWDTDDVDVTNYLNSSTTKSAFMNDINQQLAEYIATL